jgi:hypothetical protein
VEIKFVLETKKILIWRSLQIDSIYKLFRDTNLNFGTRIKVSY